MKRDILIEYIDFIYKSKWKKMIFGGYIGYALFKMFKGVRNEAA